MVSRYDIKGVVVILMTSFCSAFLFNFWSNSGIALLGQWDKSQGVVSSKGKDTVVDATREINDINTMIKLVDSHGCTIVDVRHGSLFDVGHLPGAVSFPMAEFDDIVGDFFTNYPLNTCLVLYCAGRECLDSHRFAQGLVGFGYVDVRVYSGGFAEWKERGLRVELPQEKMSTKGLENIKTVKGSHGFQVQ